MDKLSTLDAAFLRLESPVAHMHVGWLSVLELPAGINSLDPQAVRDQVASRLHLAPRFRQRVVAPPINLTEPAWADDHDFRLGDHLHVVERRAPISEAQLKTLTDAFLSRQLDRSRPLWELLVLPSVEGGRAALIGKVHHAMVDGLAAVELGMLLFDVDPAAAPGDPPPWEPRTTPDPLRIAMESMADGAVEQFRAVRSAVRLGLEPRRAARVADSMRRAALGLAEDALDPAPATFLNTTIGPGRTLVSTRLDLARLLAIKEKSSTKLNDVVLAIVAGALRRYGERRGAGPPPADLRAMVPVNVRDGSAGPAGNRIAFGFVALPVTAKTPGAQLVRSHAAMDELKRSGRIGGGDLLLRALGPMPGPVKNRAARLAASPRLYNLVISNVPGPRMALYVGGAPVREIYPVIPLSEGHALAIGVLTYEGGAHVAVHADPEVLGDIAALPRLIERAAVELERAVGLPARVVPRRRPQTRATAPAGSGRAPTA